jgi:hypothetical protein
MAEKSLWWTTGSTGDGASAYTQDEIIRLWRQMFVGDNTDEGVHKNYENELEVTGTASPVQVDTGAAVVYGFPYWNTVAESVTIPTPVANTRIDRIVLRANWTAQTVRITRLAGTEGLGTPPALTQTAGTTWEISLAQVSITTGGVITVTDEREWLHPNIEIDENRLAASVAGNGLTGGDGSALAVSVDNVTLEVSSDVVQVKDAGIDEDSLAASVTGDGLQGGAGSPLAVDVSDFAGTGLEDDGSENLRIAAAAAGSGLTGGGGSALAVNPDNATVEISSDQVRLKADGHGPSHHANRTRKFLVGEVNYAADLQSGYEQYQRHPVSVSELQLGVQLSKSYNTGVRASFIVPEDFASGMTVKFVYIPGVSSGNIVVQHHAYYAAVGEAYTTHSDGDTSNQTIAVGTANQITTCRTISLSNVAKGDIVVLRFNRAGGNAADTADGHINAVGFLVEYTADQ